VTSRPRENLRSALLLLREVSQTLNEMIAEHGDMEGSNAYIVLLTTLTADGPQRPQQLATACDLTTGGLSGLLKRLETRGVVRRTSGTIEHDRRSVVVTFTDHGRRHATEVIDMFMRGIGSRATQIKELVEALEGSDGDNGRISADAPQSTAEIVRSLAQMGQQLGHAITAFHPEGNILDVAAVTTVLAIDEAQECRPGYLADRMRISSGGMTRLLDRLERAGLVHRSYGTPATDRRGSFVHLTESGTEVARRAADAAAPLADEFFSVLRSVRTTVIDAGTCQQPRSWR